MTGRGARVVLAAAALALAAAALAWAAPRLPEGLAAAAAPRLVAREALAALAVLLLLGVPAFLADEPGRPAEIHAGRLALLAAMPPIVALVAAAGGSPAALLPPAAVLIACDLAASSYLRADPSGRGSIAWSAGAAALLGGLPIAAWAIADLGGIDGADGLLRFCPLLAARDLDGGWAAAAPSALLLVAAATALRLRAPALPAAAMLLLGLAAASPAIAQEPESRPSVIVVGRPREGPAAALVKDLAGRGVAVEERDALPWPLPPETRAVVIARDASALRDGAETMRRLALARAAGIAVLRPAGAAPVGAPDAIGTDAAIDAPGAADLAAAPRLAVPHPADRLERGVAPVLLRIPFPSTPAALPGRTLAYLAVLAVAIGAAALTARRRGDGPARAHGTVGGIAVLGTALLFLPGVLGDAVRAERWTIEERVEGAGVARRVVILRVERLRSGGGDPAFPGDDGTRWSEIRLAAGDALHGDPETGVRIDGAGRWALFAGDCGVEEPPVASPTLASMTVDDGLARREGRQGRLGETLEGALSEWSRSDDPRVAFAGALLAATLRPPPGASFAVVVPESGAAAVVIHPSRGR
ncbi:MAG TPA: hypothetical protein VFS92_00465 [Planctomycetota bacterium]|nr:hypothetical protein [Planctomycetota bacterium]